MNTWFVGLPSILAATVTAGMLFLVPLNTVDAQRSPSGTYRNSCRSISVDRGGTLKADCKTNSGSWRRSSIRLSQCKGQNIANLNGRLVCTKGSPGKGAALKKKGADRSNRNGGWNNKGHGKNHDVRSIPQSRNRGSIVLYDRAQYKGRSFTIRDNMSNLGATGYNDVSSSIRISGGGVWLVCSDKNYGGRCVNVSSDIRDLSRLGMNDRISSVRRLR